MKRKFNIVIADKNPHVRKFLQREFMSDGYGVRQAISGKDVLEKIYSQVQVDLLILDPDLPDADKLYLIKKLNDRIPAVPIVIHAYSEYSDTKDRIYATAFVEKNGNSIEQLKHVVHEILVQNETIVTHDKMHRPEK